MRGGSSLSLLCPFGTLKTYSRPTPVHFSYPSAQLEKQPHELQPSTCKMDPWTFGSIDNFGVLWALLDPFGSFLILLDPSGLLGSLLDPFGLSRIHFGRPLWVDTVGPSGWNLLDHFVLFWTDPCSLGPDPRTLGDLVGHMHTWTLRHQFGMF